MIKEEWDNKKKRNTSIEEKDDPISWEEYFMSLAILSSYRSKDPSTKVGACIVNPNDKTILSLRYNGFPRGCDDNLFPWGKGNENEEDNKYPYVFRFQKFSKEFIKNLDPLILDYFFEFDEDEWEGFDIDRSWMNLLIYQNMDCEFFEEWWENIKSKDEFISALIRFNELSEEFMDAHWNELSENHLNLIPLYQKFSLDFYHKHKFALDAAHNIGWCSFKNGEIPPEVSFDNLY